MQKEGRSAKGMGFVKQHSDKVPSYFLPHTSYQILEKPNNPQTATDADRKKKKKKKEEKPSFSF